MKQPHPPIQGVWQDAPHLTPRQRELLEKFKADTETIKALLDEDNPSFPNPDKFSDPIGFLDNGLPSGGVARHAPKSERTASFALADFSRLLAADGIAPDPHSAWAYLSEPYKPLPVDLAAEEQASALTPLNQIIVKALRQPDALVLAALAGEGQKIPRMALIGVQTQAVVCSIGLDKRLYVSLYPSHQGAAGFWHHMAFGLNLLPMNFTQAHPEPRTTAARALDGAIYSVILSRQHSTSHQSVEMGWCVSREVLWLLHPAASHQVASAESATYATLETAVHTFCSEGIHYESVI